MKKLRLELNDVQVVSFPTDDREPQAGTVNAFDATPIFACSESGGGSCESCFPNYCPPQPDTKIC